jgi:hypothetical protein
MTTREYTSTSDDPDPEHEFTLHTVSGLNRVFVLPYANHLPALSTEQLVMPSIPLPVRQELRSPQFRVGLRQVRVLLTEVPEAAVDEHRYARPREDEVSPRPSA